MPVSEAEVVLLATRAFERAGVAPLAARDAAEILTLAEMMGIATHGLSRVADYVARIELGGIDPTAQVELSAPAPALRHLHGNNGLGPFVARKALSEAMDAAKAVGVGAVFCRGANHLGALAPYLWIAAEAGFAAIITTNTTAMISPAGGRAALVGNNPLGIGVPNPSGGHALLDIALSVAARSKIRDAARTGTPIPDSWAVDAQGRPTTDPVAAMGGLMQAIGGAKGANLALCLDLLVGALSGAAILSEVPSVAKDAGAAQGLGQMFLLIHTKSLLPDDQLSDRMAMAGAMVGESPPLDVGRPVRLPGARAIAALHHARHHGFSPEPRVLENLRKLAAE